MRSVTLVLSEHEAVATSAALLEHGSPGRRGASIESVRKKLRAALDRRVLEQEEHDAEAALIAHEYAKGRTS